MENARPESHRESVIETATSLSGAFSVSARWELRVAVFGQILRSPQPPLMSPCQPEVSLDCQDKSGPLQRMLRLG
jgi:hypothetical protein